MGLGGPMTWGEHLFVPAVGDAQAGNSLVSEIIKSAHFFFSLAKCARSTEGINNKKLKRIGLTFNFINVDTPILK